MGEKGANKRGIFKNITWFEIAIIVIIFIVLFYGGYFLSFHLLGTGSVKENIITFNIIKSNGVLVPKQNNQIYLTDEQFRVIQADIKEIKKANDSRLENTLSVSTLNGFYSALFTAIAVIVAIIALISWQGLNKKIEELENVKNKYMTIKPSIDYLLKKVKYAEWVQRKFTMI